MDSILRSPLDSPVLMLMTIAYFFTSAITTFDKRLIQAKKHGSVPVDEPMLPWWVGLIAWVHWGLFLSLLILNWKYALVLFALKFVCSVLPILETVGNILMTPFRPRN